MFPFPSPLQALRIYNRPATYIKTGARQSTSESTTMDLSTCAVDDFAVWYGQGTTGPVGGAGGWTSTALAAGFIFSKRLAAADLVPGAVTCNSSQWVYAVYRGPKSLALKASGSSAGGVTLGGFTKHARSAAVVVYGDGNGLSTLVSQTNPANWTLRITALDGSAGPFISMRIWDRVAPDTYVDGTAGSLNDTGASTRGALVELLNIG